MKRLEGAVAIVTGAASGLGRAVLEDFVKEGAQVIGVDKNSDALAALKEGYSAEVCQTVGADVVNGDHAKEVWQFAVDSFGAPQIAVLNAGIEGGIAPLQEYPCSEFERIFSINVRGVFLGLRDFGREMARNGKGSLICMASGNGLRGYPGTTVYGGSKTAVMGLVRGAAAEYAPAGVRVNSVHPGFVRTPLLQGIAERTSPEDPQKLFQSWCRDIPLGRIAEPEEVARLVTFLASDDGRYITGESISIDGGLTYCAPVDFWEEKPCEV